eukprot:SAG11_NODE_19879_length_457_cov_0.860335_2_plen_46_part_01
MLQMVENGVQIGLHESLHSLARSRSETLSRGVVIQDIYDTTYLCWI